MNPLVLISNAESNLSIATYFGRTIDEFHSNELNEIYGVGQWLKCYQDELPADFSVDTYTITDGELVLASAEIIAERQTAAIEAQNAAIKEARRRLYDDPNGECAPLYWEWQESNNQEHYNAWVEAKNRVREQNQYISI